MKNILFLISFFLIPIRSFANPACAVCTVAIGASLSIARKIGVSDSIVGLWAGALLTLFGYWTILFFDKKNWNFKYRNELLILISISTIYIGEVKYAPRLILYFLYIDPILFSTFVGSMTFIYSQKLYQYMKVKNNNHAHFPFEKVILPFLFLLSISLFFYFINF